MSSDLKYLFKIPEKPKPKPRSAIEEKKSKSKPKLNGQSKDEIYGKLLAIYNNSREQTTNAVVDNLKIIRTEESRKDESNVEMLHHQEIARAPAATLPPDPPMPPVVEIKLPPPASHPITAPVQPTMVQPTMVQPTMVQPIIRSLDTKIDSASAKPQIRHIGLGGRFF